MTKVIVLKDWVPGWVRDSYMTDDEIDTFNEEYHQSQLEQGDVESVSDNQALLVRKAVAKLESLDRANLEKWLHRIPTELLVELMKS
jgi:vesicle coat complex subunit